MSLPYAKSDITWLRDNESFFREVLSTAGQHLVHLRRLETAFSPAGSHLLDFVDIAPAELERALAVCTKLMQGLGPTAQAMRDELERRTSH